MVLGSLKKLPKYLGSKYVAMANSSLWLYFQWIWIHWSWHSLELVWKLKMRENQNKTVAGYRTDSLRVSADTDTHADTPIFGRCRYRYHGIGRTLFSISFSVKKKASFGNWSRLRLFPRQIETFLNKISGCICCTSDSHFQLLFKLSKSLLEIEKKTIRNAPPYGKSLKRCWKVKKSTISS